jgi:hypothetical protein
MSRLGKLFERALPALSALAGFLVSQVLFEAALQTFFTPLFSFLREHVSDVVLQFLFFALVIVIAVGLYLLRSKRRRIYASLEIMIGVAIAVYATNEIYRPTEGSFPAKSWFAGMAGIYVIIRGLDNWFHPKKV